MKWICSLLLFCLVTVGYSQSAWKNEDAVIPSKSDSLMSGIQKNNLEQPIIRIRCGTTSTSVEPLYVLDGIPITSEMLSRLNPNRIESITVLKDAHAAALYGSRGVHGVIIIVSKEEQCLVVKDSLDKVFIPGATIELVWLNNLQDTVRKSVDDWGKGTMEFSKKGSSFKLVVSSIGYKPYEEEYENVALLRDEVLLERFISYNQEVVVGDNAISHFRILNKIVCIAAIRQNEVLQMEEKNINSVVETSIFPNPVIRGGNITISLSKQHEQLMLVFLDMNGKMLKKQFVANALAKSNISIETNSVWAAGIYLLQIFDEQGRQLKVEKIVLQ